jgi:hypothetical protein
LRYLTAAEIMWYGCCSTGLGHFVDPLAGRRLLDRALETPGDRGLVGTGLGSQIVVILARMQLCLGQPFSTGEDGKTRKQRAASGPKRQSET